LPCRARWGDDVVREPEELEPEELLRVGADAGADVEHAAVQPRAGAISQAL